ncbi:hypothetical protein [Luteimonas salinilitoris]|uniref:Uncharacterized protein n=1 Tax=Luteimonas salinilitoris TaxID=3237697 RepID=A0ABV4HP83_9GAMM
MTTSHPDLGRAGPLNVEKYQVFAELQDGSDSKFSLDLPPSQTHFRIPWEILRHGQVVKYEIQVRDENGNQTAIESCFTRR